MGGQTSHMEPDGQHRSQGFASGAVQLWSFPLAATIGAGRPRSVCLDVLPSCPSAGPLSSFPPSLWIDHCYESAFCPRLTPSCNSSLLFQGWLSGVASGCHFPSRLAARSRDRSPRGSVPRPGGCRRVGGGPPAWCHAATGSQLRVQGPPR